MIQVKEVIVTDMARKGTGTHITSPIRALLEVYTRDGELLAFHDSRGNYSVEDVIEFSNFRLLHQDLPIETALQQWRPY